ncbi:hypothetical protein C7T94_18765 [Pedobacter yulinensis]|uniref:DUF5683 domain-containing protein n=1 Tax=Pedobacter yulinensis TaxID=2126353 RepID=A0A2T3HGU3_9SPHI|nr:DUF5683 domain-containing protein [Pedobacter yulinensis]PST81657.1 hypothetical protein C7T94_18765 [Pedobacter yulinensis]
MFKTLTALALFFCCFSAIAQETTADSSRRAAVPERRSTRKSDTLKSTYINPGKVAARQAVLRSAIIPGWGQLRNYNYLVNKTDSNGRKTAQFWEKSLTLGKAAGIYVAGTLLTVALVDNTKKYRAVVEELRYRAANNDQANPNGPYFRYTNAGLIEGKNVFERNREIIFFSYVIAYAANLIDTYVSARMNYFDVDQNLKISFRPTVIPANQLYGYNFAPGLKVTLKL